MDMRYVLLSSKGRIGSRTFLRGLSVITAAFILVQIANTFISPMFGILFYPMVYVYVCLWCSLSGVADQAADQLLKSECGRRRAQGAGTTCYDGDAQYSQTSETHRHWLRAPSAIGA